MSAQPIARWDRETTVVAQVAACVSLFSFLFYLRHSDLLLYGDAVAHINIARRVFDSRTPGLLQLGTVWLPLPHLLMILFLLSDSAGQTGIGGSIPSMLAYVLGTVGVFRLTRSMLSVQARPDLAVRAAAWFAAILYAANPNLLYMQTTAMTEPLYLASSIWAVVHFSEFARTVAGPDAKTRAAASLVKCGFCLAGACLTRYDGWFLTGAVAAAAMAVMLRSGRSDKVLRRGLAKFILLAVAGPVLWLAYNAIIYGNPLEFANGPYSARAIEQKITSLGASPHPGWHDLPVAFSYFFKAAEHTIAEGSWQKLWVAMLLAGTCMIVANRKLWPLLLLWVPLPFYMLSLAYGSTPIYLPDWWPHSYYNVRFGLELVPAFAVSAGLTIHFALRFARSGWARTAIVVTPCILLAGSYASVWRAQPICFREAWINSRSRIALETELASTLKKLPRDSTLLMYLGDHVGALQRAGIPLRRLINEGNHRPWKRPSDPEGLWERALENPKQYADYVVALEADPVAREVQKRDLTSMVVIHTAGQPSATIYWTHRSER